jgi:hypothetical protein
VHAPRQTGKTTTLAALARNITADGRQVALLFSCERARIYEEDPAAAAREILQAISREARVQRLPAELMPPAQWPAASPGSLLVEGLGAWVRACPLPLALFFDEIDSLRGPALLSVLSQLRDGFRSRPRDFPAAVVLCGLRDIRDYRIAAGRDPARVSSSSPFNIKVKSLRMGDFTRAQVAELYAQRTGEAGQEFTADAVDRAFGYTRGQPWLVNALVREITEEMGVVPPPRTSRQRTAALSVTVTLGAPGTDRSTSVPGPGSALPPVSRSRGGGAPAGVLTRSSAPPAPKAAVPILSSVVPVSTSRVALDRGPAARVTVFGVPVFGVAVFRAAMCAAAPGGRADADEQAATAITAAAPATASQRLMTGITTPRQRA